MVSPRYFAVVPAAGVGARLSANIPKQYLPVAGKPMLLHVLETFAFTKSIAHCYVVVSQDDGYIQEAMQQVPELQGRISLLFAGGATRQQSVMNGLAQIRAQVADDDWVLVHDAARPGLTAAMVEGLIQTLQNDAVGGLLAMPIVDTLKRSTGDQRIETTVARAGLWAAQTPQMFRYALLRRALEQAAEVTDEASAVEALGLAPKLVEGSARNFKITLPQDVALAELLLKGLE